MQPDDVAILGTGAMGLARALSRAGVRVALGSRDEARAREQAALLGGPVRGLDHTGAVRASGVVVLAVGYEHAMPLLPELAEALRGKVVVDPITPWDEHIPPTSAAEELARLLPPGAELVGAWKTTFAAELDAARPGESHDALLCGDSDPAKARVAALVRATGFCPLDCGPLAQARVLEGMCRIMGPIARNLGLPRGRAPAWRFIS